ncbi:glycosyltransferase [Paenibacillus gallinarum]|uniref:Glycosyltransferase n=1 Tax=Paenibacillus gallinarum TaxID=2762232 RepID=A0ABR8SZF8_9BACL|nr:glycosyltransferase [Paenibacillus gallinarum]MBD7968900.1 glycosyltransferase [Paenibacillus gallinarum]
MKIKKILLSTHSLVDFAGAEINILSLAQKLISLNYEVDVATLQYDYPIQENFEIEGIAVWNLTFTNPETKHYDLIWSQHAQTLNNIIFEKNITANKIVFSSLSPFEPFEAPPIFSNLLSLCLANSVETAETLMRENVQPAKIKIFPNFAPEDFINSSKKVSDTILKVGVVSNHIPEEIYELARQLEKKSIQVDFYGINHQTRLITSEIMLEWDAVITIGKSVQYALVMGLPVFCYDIHGGPGWINESNYEISKEYNFSGRGTVPIRNSKELLNEFMQGYNQTISAVKILQEKSRLEFDLDSNVKEILNQISDITIDVDIEEIKSSYLVVQRQNRAFLREYEYNNYRKKVLNELHLKIQELDRRLHKSSINEDRLVKEIQNYRAINSTDKSQIIDLKNQLSEIEIKEKFLKDELIDKSNNITYLAELNHEKDQYIDKIVNSKAWKLAEVLRKTRHKFKKVINDPSIVIRRIRKRGADFGTPIKRTTEFLNTSNIPLVSVVIPVYDRTDVLVSSIESILNQTYKNLELLIVCDGSPESTINIVKSYESDKRVRIFYYKDNSGNAVRGRNKAIREARGEYLAFQDSDDIAELTRLEDSIEFFQKYHVDIIYGGWRALVDGSRLVDLKDKQEVFSPDCDYELLSKICVPCQSTVMAKLEALRAVGGLKSQMRYREDHELWLRLSYYGYKFKSIPKILTNLRLHENNLELTFKSNDNHWESLMVSEHKIINIVKPKIGYIIAGTGISGGLGVICQHANGLHKRGYDVVLISEDNNNEVKWFPNLLVPVIPISQVPENLDVAIATYWTTAYTLENISAQQKYYFIQSDESKFFDVNSKERAAAYKTYSMNYGFITMAQWISDWLKKEFNKDSHYIPNGVDENIIYKTEPLMKKNGKIRILLEGPIDVPFKGMKEAFEVVENLDCEVWCVSTAGRPRPNWKCDRFFESVPMDKMKNIYSSCDILLKMSKVESFCLPALEMMACGGVCVLTNFNGVEEFVKDGINGVIIDIDDIEGARNAIKKIIEDKQYFNDIRREAIETAKEWGWERSIDKLDALFAPQDLHDVNNKNELEEVI